VITQSVGPPPPATATPPPATPSAPPAAGPQAAGDTIVTSTVTGGSDVRAVAGGAVGPGPATTTTPGAP
jgi:hypothetical protein